MEYFIDAFKYKYAQFDGRARRKEFWMFNLFYFLLAMVLAGLDNMLWAYPILGMALGLVALIPSLAIACRRLHDTNRSGWWLLIGLVPLIGFIVLLVFFCTDGTPGENIYGANPKEVGEGVSSHLVEDDIV